MIHPSTEQPPVIAYVRSDNVRSDNFNPAYFCFCHKPVVRKVPSWVCEGRDKTALGSTFMRAATLKWNLISIDVKVRCFY